MTLQYKIDLETKFREIYRQDRISNKDVKKANQIIKKLKKIEQ